MTDQRRVQLGDTDAPAEDEVVQAFDRVVSQGEERMQRNGARGDPAAPAEDEVVQAFDRVVSQGAQRLHRTWREVLSTGLAGGLEVGVGVLALVAGDAEDGRHTPAGAGR